MEDRPVEALPNIGPKLGARLRSIGLSEAGDFLAKGDAEAFLMLAEAFPEEACSHTRLALAGAARGMRWQTLPPAVKAAVKRELP